MERQPGSHEQGRGIATLCVLVSMLGIPQTSKGFMDSTGRIMFIPGESAGSRIRPKMYTVQPGDTLGKIAERFCRKYHAFQNLAEYNEIKNPDKITPGQELNVDNPGACDGLYM